MKEQLEKLIKKYSTRLKTLNENLKNEGDYLNDDEYKMFLAQIHLTAEISRDLKILFQEYFEE